MISKSANVMLSSSLYARDAVTETRLINEVEGLSSIKSILQTLIPQWPAGPHDWQVESTANILDGHDQLVVAACGDGKTAAAYLHILLRHELLRDPDLSRHGLDPLVKNPVVLMVTPLTDLARSQMRESKASSGGRIVTVGGYVTGSRHRTGHGRTIYKPSTLRVHPSVAFIVTEVEEMKRMRVSAVSLDKETIAEAKKRGEELLRNVQRCLYSMVIVSPERLTSPQFDNILRTPTFHNSIVLYVIDEAHIVIPWGRSSTCYDGHIKHAITRGLTAVAGISSGLLQVNSSDLRATKHANYIAWVASGHWKVLVYCPTIDLGYRVASYLWRTRPSGDERFRNIRMYNSLVFDKDNAETIRAFREDSDTFVIVATVKFGMGVDLRKVDASINLGLPDSAEAILQQNGRAGRDPNTKISAGFTYIEPSIVKLVEEDEDNDNGYTSDGEVMTRFSARSKDAKRSAQTVKGGNARAVDDLALLEKGARTQQKRTEDVLLRGLVQCHINQKCLVAEFNRIFGSPGSASQKTCIEADRDLPCSSCMTHLPPPPPSASSSPTPPASCPLPFDYATLPTAVTLDSAQSTAMDADEEDSAAPMYRKLTKAMIGKANEALDEVCEELWMEQDGARFELGPPTSLIPLPLRRQVIANFHMIRTYDLLAGLLSNWEHLPTYGHRLFDVIGPTNEAFDAARAESRRQANESRAKTRRQKAKRKIDAAKAAESQSASTTCTATHTPLSSPHRTPLLSSPHGPRAIEVPTLAVRAITNHNARAHAETRLMAPLSRTCEHSVNTTYGLGQAIELPTSAVRAITDENALPTPVRGRKRASSVSHTVGGNERRQRWKI
ncbi:hypothetical protein EW146_g9430 [Bondarzewia mesenterica]|uniref:DNA 3'-5' helicase n=1 Tax=Bondarzewia mesenterica TaxID=1095465 RepID=A0A4V3XCT2_9AGAM|nr:hypothetical protein EW146_g9430 [Bondarzewia mesenterica]